MAYNGSTELIAGITQKNGGNFPLVNASAVYIDDNTRLDGKLANIANNKADKATSVSTIAYDSTGQKLTKTINGVTTDVFNASALPVSTATQTALSNKADKSSSVSTVSYDATNKKFTKTINGTTSDIVEVSTIAGAMDVISSAQIDALFQ